MTFRYLDYEASRQVPNIVVDGSPNESSVLALSHWPGVAAPPGLARDLSAEMAFAYLDTPVEHPRADVVTNNHFDQDGIVSIHALIEPESSLAHRELLIDVAAAGDFATYRDRRAARASMVLSRFAEADNECEYDEFTDQLYTELLPQLMTIVLDNDRHRELWADEDDQLTASEQAIASGAVTIDEHPDADLAVITIAHDQPVRSGHRFGGQSFEGLHPMAINNATGRFRLLIVHGRRYRYIDRYETWVQFQSHPVLARVDMRPLAEQLTAQETSTTTWSAGSLDSLSPELSHDGESSIVADALQQLVIDQLRV